MFKVINGYIIEKTEEQERKDKYEHDLEEADRDYEDEIFEKLNGGN